MRRAAKTFMIDAASLGLLVLFWYGATASGWVPRVFVPSPIAVYLRLVAGFTKGTLLLQTWSTIFTMVKGWLLSSILGIALGSVIGIWPLARKSLAPVLEIFRPMPPAAIIPVAIAIFGLTSQMALGVVVFGAMWPALLATVHGFSSVDPRLKEVGQALNLSPLEFIWKIGLPNATPDIIAGMRLSMTVSLVLVVVTDMITGHLGLGSLVVMATRTFDMAGLFSGLVLLAIIGLCSNGLLQGVERSLLSYRR